MPLANVQQVAAPDFTGIGELLRGANTSFNNAFSSANDVLGQYQAGQTAKADGAFIDAIKNAADEKSLTAALGGIDFSKSNLSPEMQKVALGLRDQVLGYDTTRIGNRNSIDSNARANAGENRTQTDWVYGNNARDALNAATPGFINGYVGALTVGQAAPGTQGTGAGPRVGPTMFAAAEKNYGLPAGYLETTAQIESSGNPNARNPNSSAGGLFQQTDSNAKDYGVTNKFDPAQSTEGAAKFAADNADILRKRLGREPTGAELYLAHQQGGGGASALLSNPNARAADIVGADAVKLNGGDPNMSAGEFAGLWINKYNKIAGTPSQGGATPGPNGYTGGQTNGYYQNPAMLAGLDAIKGLAASGTLSPEAAKGLIDTLSGAAQSGQTQINDRNTADQALQVAAAQNKIALDPTILTDAQRQTALAQTPGLNPLSVQSGAAGLNTLSAPGGALGAVANPATVADPAVQAAVDQQNAADQLALSSSADARKNDLLTKFTNADDPVAALVEQANKSGGGAIFGSTTANSEDTRKAVQTLADAAGVSVDQMAATLSDMTDPSTEQRGWGLNNRPSLPALLTAASTGGLDSLRNFFNDPNGTSPSGFNAIIAQAKKDAASNQSYTSKATANQKSTADRETAKVQIDRTTQEIAKLSLVNPGDPQISVLQKKLQDLKQGLFNNASPVQDAISRVKLYTPGSPDFVREMTALSAAIDADPNIKDKAGAKKAAGITP